MQSLAQSTAAVQTSTIDVLTYPTPTSCEPHAEAFHLFNLKKTRGLVPPVRVPAHRRHPKTGKLIEYERRLPRYGTARLLLKYIAQVSGGSWYSLNIHKAAAVVERSTRTVWRSLRLLEAMGLIEWERGKYTYSADAYKPFHREFGRVAIATGYVKEVYDGHLEAMQIRRAAVRRCAEAISIVKVRVIHAPTQRQDARTRTGVIEKEASISGGEWGIPREMYPKPHPGPCTCANCFERWTFDD